MLQENNVRQEFFELPQFLMVLGHLARHVQPVIRFAYVTGCSVSEVLPLKWEQVDFQAQTVRLEPGTTKNKRARIFPLADELKAMLKEQFAKHQELLARGIDCPWVFNYNGRRLKSFRKAWKTACRGAGVSGRIPHDFRRTAVRNLTRAGIVERVAMEMTGHLTRAVFERYNIVSHGDVEHAKTTLNSKVGTISGTEPIDKLE
jgi:integrase